MKAVFTSVYFHFIRTVYHSSSYFFYTLPFIQHTALHHFPLPHISRLTFFFSLLTLFYFIFYPQSWALFELRQYPGRYSSPSPSSPYTPHTATSNRTASIAATEANARGSSEANKVRGYIKIDLNLSIVRWLKESASREISPSVSL